MQSIRRSCQSALRGLEKQSIPTNVSRRTLSSTCARRRGALPVYLPPSNAELETLLADLNSKVLLTAQLNRVQQKLVYKKENIAKLDNEPIEVTLGDVSLPLVHIDRVRDIPARWKQLREIVSRSATNEDWENVIRVMEGFERAGISLREERREMIVRKLNENGMQHLVLKSLQRASATGLRLRDFLVLRQVVKGVHDKAATAGWAEKETQKALSFAEQIVELMEDVEHCGKSKPEFDFRTKPMVVALPVEMAATIAKNHGGNTEKTFKYAKRLMNTLKQNEFLAADLSEVARLTNTLRPEIFQSAHSQMTALTNFCFKIWELVPVRNALNASRRVLDTAMPMAVEALKLETKIADVLEKSSETAQLLRYRDGKQLCSEQHIASSIAEAVKRKQ